MAEEVGDEIAVGDEIVEIETDKANMAYESDVAGTLTEILAEEGETLPIGTPIARVGDSGEGPSALSCGSCRRGGAPAASGAVAEALLAPADGACITGATRGRGSESMPGRERTPDGNADVRAVKASPVARRMAKEKGVDLASFEGSGPAGGSSRRT